MGSGTLVDGVRRWFQRRSSTSTSATHTAPASDNAATLDSGVLVTAFPAPSSASAPQSRPHRRQRQPQDQEAAPALTLIKVPKRRPMDSNKKVCLSFSPRISSYQGFLHFPVDNSLRGIQAS